jgi:hypothetical protein
MDTHVILAVAAIVQATVSPPPAKAPPPPVVTSQFPPAQRIAAPEARCNAGPWQRLVGRTISDLLTVKLPEGTRIYRIDDPPGQAIGSGRLSVEVNRSTRVRRVYCS